MEQARTESTSTGTSPKALVDTLTANHPEACQILRKLIEMAVGSPEEGGGVDRHIEELLDTSKASLRIKSGSSIHGKKIDTDIQDRLISLLIALRAIDRFSRSRTGSVNPNPSTSSLASFSLLDANNTQKDKITGSVIHHGSGLLIRLDGYGDNCFPAGSKRSAPICIARHKGELKVMLWVGENHGAPTEVIDLESSIK